MKILAIIPARGGSKSIPKKNIAPLLGKPLIAWTIEAAKRSKYIDKIIVSSDSDEILLVGEKAGAFPVKRPKKLASDRALPEPLILHALGILKKKQGYVPDLIIYLQPTSPLRGVEEIDAAFDLFFKTNSSGVISAREIEKKYLKTFILSKKGFLMGAVNNEFPFMNRQELPQVFLPNGAIFIITRKEYLRTGQLISNKTIPFFMSEETSIDIDGPEDLVEVAKILKKRK